MNLSTLYWLNLILRALVAVRSRGVTPQMALLQWQYRTRLKEAFLLRRNVLKLTTSGTISWFGSGRGKNQRPLRAARQAGRPSSTPIATNTVLARRYASTTAAITRAQQIGKYQNTETTDDAFTCWTLLWPWRRRRLPRVGRQKKPQASRPWQ